MAQDKRQVDAITARDVDFAQWYTDVCKKAELIDYTSVKGMFIYRPYGYAIWENIQTELDRRFKATGHENVYLPVLIPESLLQKEKDHVEGFAPECAWVTMGGSEKLEDPSSTTSGAPCCAGKRPPVPSCVTGSFCGRRATPCTPRRKRPGKRPCRC